MSETIWKFPISITDEQTIEALCIIRKVLHVGLDPSGVPCLWAVVRPCAVLSLLHIVIVGTGNPFPEDVAPGNHLGSFVDGSFVWHVFEAHR